MYNVFQVWRYFRERNWSDMNSLKLLKLLGLHIILVVIAFLYLLPAGEAQADGAGGFPTPTAMIVIIPTIAPSPTAPLILDIASPYPYPFPLPQDNSLNMILPESQADSAVIPENEGKIPANLCIPAVIVAVVIGLIGLNRIRKNYQGD